MNTIDRSSPAVSGADPARSASLLGAGAIMLGIDFGPGSALAQGDEKVLTEALVLRDPDIPVTGNPDGDITIVEYFDYNCPYCRKVAPELRQVVQDDGKVRLVLKDWPVLGEVSTVAARMVLASKYQDKYFQAHDALIGVVLETDRAAHSRTARAAPASTSIAPTATSPPTPRRSTPSSRATAIRPWHSASRARRPSSSANSGCRAS